MWSCLATLSDHLSLFCCVRQDDVLFHNLTVRETLDFAARMRLPASVPPGAKAARVDAIIAQLGLAGAAEPSL